jgi:uncharacterized alpha-E superfamily protein
VISRVADHCFWLGRYLERAENTARVLQVTRNLSLDAALTPRQCWQPVVVVSGEEARFAARFGAGMDDGEAVQRYLSWDEENLCSIVRSIGAARENARSIREVVSLETWEALNELHLWISRDEARTRYRGDRDGFYRHVRRACQLAMGLLQGTMLHDDPYHFIVLGTMLERAGQTARLLDVHHHALTQLATHQVVETAVFLALLRACSGFEPFMKRNRFSISGAYGRLEHMRPASEVGSPGAESLERLRALDTWIAAQRPAALEAGPIHALLTRVVDESATICDAIGRELLGQPAPALEQRSAQ